VVFWLFTLKSEQPVSYPEEMNTLSPEMMGSAALTSFFVGQSCFHILWPEEATTAEMVFCEKMAIVFLPSTVYGTGVA
jgi:hypothetical protein